MLQDADRRVHLHVKEEVQVGSARCGVSSNGDCAWNMTCQKMNTIVLTRH